MTLKLPVLSYSTGVGWLTLGYATSVSAARGVILRILADASHELLSRGFELKVFRRTDLHRELNGGPDGYTWSIGMVTGQRSTMVQHRSKVPPKSTRGSHG